MLQIWFQLIRCVRADIQQWKVQERAAQGAGELFADSHLRRIAA